jgi:hypothetical protein
MESTTVFHRVLEPVLRSIPPEATRQIAEAQADNQLQQIIETLARKANEGDLTPEEQREYQAYVDAGDVVATMQAVARKLVASAGG